MPVARSARRWSSWRSWSALVVVDVVVVDVVGVVVGVVVGGVVVGGVAAAVPWRLARKLRSDEPSEFWWTSTASTLVPLRMRAGSSTIARSRRSSVPEKASGARVSKPIGPLGMLTLAAS